MTSPRKLARQRARQKRQAEQMKNLERGAAEQAAKKQRPINPDDPLGQVQGGSAAIRVVSAPGVEPTKPGQNPTPASGAGQPPAGMQTGSKKRRSMANVQVVGNTRSVGNVKVQRRGNANALGARVLSGGNPQGQPQSQPAQRPQGPMVNPMAAPSLPTRPAASAAERADVTVILTCFERPQMYRQQLDALRNQTMQPAVTMAWVNTGSVPQDERAMSAGEVVVIRSNVNMGPWVRFTMAREARTKYVCILDDDTIPGRGWIQACIERLEQAEADAIEAGDEEDPGTYCIAAAGEVFRSDDPKNRYYIGPQSPRDEEMEVDIGRQGWFFRRDMIQAFLNYPRQGDGTIGWGLHFAAALQMLGVLTVVLPYEYENKEAWGMLQPASMENSLSSKLQAQAQAQGGKSLEYMRAEIYQAYRHVGWAPLVVLDAEMDEEEASAGG